MDYHLLFRLSVLLLGHGAYTERAVRCPVWGGITLHCLVLGPLPLQRGGGFFCFLGQ
jgi:hypothetical protein